MSRGIWKHQINISICTGLGDEKVQCKTESGSILRKEIYWTLIIDIKVSSVYSHAEGFFQVMTNFYTSIFTRCATIKHIEWWRTTLRRAISHSLQLLLPDGQDVISVCSCCCCSVHGWDHYYADFVYHQYSTLVLNSYYICLMVKAVSFATLNGMFNAIMYSAA